jgi:TPR repeat protein
MSADQANPAAQFNYGVHLYNGSGVERNLALAAHYFKQSADQGNANAQFNYGKVLLSGNGVAVDKALAMRYFRMAANQGHEDAISYCSDSEFRL